MACPNIACAVQNRPNPDACYSCGRDDAIIEISAEQPVPHVGSNGCYVAKIFSGEESRDLWEQINALDATATGDEIRDVLYNLCCKLQKLENILKQ